MIVVIQEAYTPSGFSAKRYRVLIKKSLLGKLRKAIEGEGYGFLYSEALIEAQDWSHLLNCGIIESQL